MSSRSLDVRHKLKAQYLGLTGPEIVKLKQAGTEITRRVEVPQVAFLGDTAASNYSDDPDIARARALLIECTFFDPDHVQRARAGKHLHVYDLPEVLEGMENERIIIIHVTRRTHLAAARKILRKRLGKDLAERVTFLMSQRQLED
jgi:ribonuclease Z